MAIPGVSVSVRGNGGECSGVSLPCTTGDSPLEVPEKNGGNSTGNGVAQRGLARDLILAKGE